MHIQATSNVTSRHLCLLEGVLQTRVNQLGLTGAVSHLPVCAVRPCWTLSSSSQGKACNSQTMCLCIACACRKAIVRAGVRQPSMIHVGLTSMMDYMGEMDKAAFNSTLHKGMSMTQQVDRFQVRLAQSC